MAIVSHPANNEYRDGWSRIFAPKKSSLCPGCSRPNLTEERVCPFCDLFMSDAEEPTDDDAE